MHHSDDALPGCLFVIRHPFRLIEPEMKLGHDLATTNWRRGM
jgi:hypothetical protein